MSTYTPIASITLSSAQSSVTFSGIPQTYTDLVLVINGYDVDGNGYLTMQFNSDTGSNYSRTTLSGNGSTTSSIRNSNSTVLYPTIGSSSTNIGGDIIQIQNYSNSNTYKTLLFRGSQTGSATIAQVGLWRSTSAITSIKLSAASGNIASGSTFNLYGVANASITNTAKATGGDTITTDGTYWYHTFRSSGTFTPTQALSNVDFLVIAGGGGGGYDASGGGGAGGYRNSVTGETSGRGSSAESKLSLTAQAYTVTVGAGGAAGTNTNGSFGSNGNNSVFDTITSIGGGRGSVISQGAGASGGAGGGAGAGTGGGTNAGGAGTANQGYDGGSAEKVGGAWAAGGGGGAGSAGGNATNGVSGVGGNGLSSSITGTAVTRAGGGGGGNGSSSGGAGGSGGGGAGSGPFPAGSATDGTANTGSGGGGMGNANQPGKGGNGGSGIVIIRYAA